MEEAVGSPDARLRAAINATLVFVLETIESGDDPHLVPLPERLVASGRHAVANGLSPHTIRRLSAEGLEVLQAAVLEEIDHVASSNASRTELRNEIVEVQNVLLERLLAAVGC